jgi:hypothetical protein
MRESDSVGWDEMRGEEEHRGWGRKVRRRGIRRKI